MSRSDRYLSLRAAVEVELDAAQLYEHMHVLCDRIGPRSVGSVGEVAARDYLLATLRTYGLRAVRAEPFPTLHWQRGITGVTITRPLRRPLELFALPFTQSAAVAAEVIWTTFSTHEAFARVAPTLEGKVCINKADVAVNLSGTVLHRAERARLARDAGAAAFVWVTGRPGNLPATGCINPRVAEGMPAFAASLETGLLLKRLTDKAPVWLEIDTHNRVQEGTSWNVLAEVGPQDKQAPVVVLTAHYDTHDITSGAFDNAAGCAVVLEYARLATRLGNAGCRVQFLFTSGEEYGLRGAMHYVKAHRHELPNIRLQLNVDGLGADATYPFVHSAYHSKLVRYLSAVLEGAQVRADVKLQAAYNWDHVPFALEGVPAASLTSSWDVGAPHYAHTVADTLDKIDLQTLTHMSLCASLITQAAVQETFWDVEPLPKEMVLSTIKEKGQLHHLDNDAFAYPLALSR